jgi:hypothetical protein
MEKTITIKLSTGKEIQLTESEYEELKEGFQEWKEIPIPCYPAYRGSPAYWPYFPDFTTSWPWANVR